MTMHGHGPVGFTAVGMAAALCAACASGPRAVGQTLDCGGFEDCTPLTIFPTVFGVWGVDAMATTGAALGVTPLEGARMLQFDCTLPSTDPCHSFGATGSDLTQLVDLSASQSIVAAGLATAYAEASFNRVSGDGQTDTQFSLTIRAYLGTPQDYEATASSFLAQSSTALLSDGDPETWERVTVEFAVPSNADYVAITVSAVENIADDGGGSVEFDGHFADRVALTVLPPNVPSVSEWGLLTFTILVSGAGATVIHRTRRASQAGGIVDVGRACQP